MKYPKPHVVQIKPGIVVELTTEEAIKLIQELFSKVYGETPVPSTPPLVPEKYVKPLVPYEEPYKPTWVPRDYEKWPDLQGGKLQ